MTMAVRPAPALLAAAWSADVAAIGVGVVLLLVVALLFALLLLSRRQHREALAQITLAIEELRSGRLRTRPEVDPRSPFKGLADSVARLAQDLGGRLGDVARTGTKLETLLEMAHEYVLVTTDVDGDIRAVAGRTEGLFGWRDHELVGRSVSMLFDAESWKEVLPRLARRTLREKGIETQAVMQRRAGERFPARIAVRLLHTPDGEATGFLLGVQDLSRTAALEEEVRQTETRYRELLDGLPGGAAILRGGRLVYANAALERLLGIPLENLTGQALRDRVATYGVLVLQERLAALERGAPGETDTLPVTLVPASGRAPVEAELRLAAVRYQGQPAVIAIVLDKGESLRAEEEVRASQARLDGALEAMIDGVVVLTETPSGAFVRMTNQAFLSMFDLGRERVLGASEGELLRMLRERGEGAENVSALLAGSAATPRREPVVLGSGERAVQLECVLAPFRDASGARVGRILICRDLSEQKALEGRLQAHAEILRESRESLEETVRQLQEAHAQLAERSTQLEALNEELRALDRMKSDLLASVSHELQTPLVAVRGYTEMVLKGRLGPLTEEQRRGLELSLRNVDRMITMIDELFDLVRGRPETLRLAAFPLESLVEEAVGTVAEMVRQKKILVRRRIDDCGFVVRGDRNKLLQVFLNLLSNAVKYNREAGEIEISARRGRPGFVLVQVRDTGVGIPEDELERIFERGYRAAAGGQGQEGAGLGLYIVKQVLRLHGCTIQATSRVGEGTVVSFTLPMVREEGERDEQRKEERGAAPIPRETERAAGEEGQRAAPARPQDDGPREPASPPRLRIIRK